MTESVRGGHNSFRGWKGSRAKDTNLNFPLTPSSSSSSSCLHLSLCQRGVCVIPGLSLDDKLRLLHNHNLSEPTSSSSYPPIRITAFILSFCFISSLCSFFVLSCQRGTVQGPLGFSCRIKRQDGDQFGHFLNYAFVA